jgi:hypothetical protein
LIKNLRNKACIRKKLSLSNKIFYENKTRGVLAKNNKKTRKIRKRNTLIIFKKTPNITLLYTLRQISKSERNKKINKKEIGIKEDKEYYKIKPEEVLEKTKY